MTRVPVCCSGLAPCLFTQSVSGPSHLHPNSQLDQFTRSAHSQLELCTSAVCLWQESRADATSSTKFSWSSAPPPVRRTSFAF